MKQTARLQSKVTGWGLALLIATWASVLPAQQPLQGAAKIVRIKGAARYTTGDNKWHPLNVGDVLKPGTIIQTASDSQVDMMLWDRDEVSERMITPVFVYKPDVEARVNMIRMYENTVLSLDKLSWMETGADLVTETQLDLRAGRIFGTVKKMPAASRYEVKFPNGVAGIRGTIYMLDASGLIKVLTGQVVMSYVKPDGSIVTQVVQGGQMYDPVTGLLTPIPARAESELILPAKDFGQGPPAPPTAFAPDRTLEWVSPGAPPRNP
ncbi:MAG: FecR domain-containing protein [Verrucomicrobiae bacterium]|nr:FecR domain-containing protein [Verrucomicrobiae bacterium]